MTPTRIKTALGIILAFGISSTLMRFITFGDTPRIDTAKIVTETKQIQTMMRTSVASTFSSAGTIASHIFSSPFSTWSSNSPSSSDTSSSEQTEPTNTPSEQSSSISFETAPTTTPGVIIVTTEPSIRVPTSNIFPSYAPSQTTPTVTQSKPTSTPKPTSKPEPTKEPELPPITSTTRPGSNLDDIYNDVAKRLCVPAALMKAIQTEETGSRLTNYAKSNFSFINTYNWWNDAKTTKTDLFNAAAYSAQSGIVPSDSKFAGEKIAQAIQPDAYDQIIMGLLQVSQQEQDLSFKNTSKIITAGKIDRRVLYDNVLIFASVTKNKVGNLAETGCGNWSERAIARAACKHLGACNYNYGANNGNYCTKICNHYNEFAGTNYNCANISSLMEANGDDGKCTLK